MHLMLAAVMMIAGFSPAMAVDLGAADAGLAYARESCGECHAVEPNDFSSPILEAPGFEEIANIPAMSRLALVSFFQTSHELMPNFVVPPEEVDNLVVYIMSLKN
jgi:mono/diheme cytochrome c family protein